MTDKTFGERIKIWLEVILLTGTLMLFAGIAIQPHRVVDWCKSAGFTKCTVLGAEYQSQFLDAEQQAGETKAQLVAVSEKVDALSKAIQAAQIVGPPEVKQKLQAQAQATANAVGQIEKQAERNLKAISSVVDQVVKDGEWAVVFGGFPEFAPASEKVAKAKSLGIANARVFQRDYDGKVAFRSVALFDDRDAARQAITTVNTFSSRKDAYLVNMANWCKVKRNVIHEKYGDISVCQ